MQVLFVGDCPSRLNTDPNIAFIGTPSHKNLCKWIDKMNISMFRLINSDKQFDLDEIAHLYHVHKFKIVALGGAAAKRLNSIEIAHFGLPHPSPRNRILNNKLHVDKILKKCKKYLES